MPGPPQSSSRMLPGSVSGVAIRNKGVWSTYTGTSLRFCLWTFLENGLQWLGVMIKSRFHTSVDRQSAQGPADSDWEVPGFSMVCLPKIHMLGSWWRISVLEDGVQQVPEMDGVQQEVLRSLKTERMPLEGAKVCLLGLLITTPPLISPSHTWLPSLWQHPP